MEAVTNGVNMNVEFLGDGLCRTERLGQHEGGGEVASFTAIVFQQWREQSGRKGTQVFIKSGIG